MKYAILINSGPTQSGHARYALNLINALLDSGHQVIRVFFYQEGVFHAFRFNQPPEDEFAITHSWSALAKKNQIDLVVCISAAQRRALLCADEARRQSKLDNDVADGFRISGLGQWVEACLLADRVIEF